MKTKRIPVILVGLALILAFAGCSKPVELGGVYVVDEYQGENEAILEFLESLGCYVEPTADGYAFVPVVIQEGELIALSEEPWSLLESEKNRYRIFLYLGDVYGAVFGPEALQAELEEDPYMFNYSLEVKAQEDGLKGKIVGGGESDRIHLTRLEDQTE